VLFLCPRSRDTNVAKVYRDFKFTYCLGENQLVDVIESGRSNVRTVAFNYQSTLTARVLFNRYSPWPPTTIKLLHSRNWVGCNSWGPFEACFLSVRKESLRSTLWSPSVDPGSTQPPWTVTRSTSKVSWPMLAANMTRQAPLYQSPPHHPCTCLFTMAPVQVDRPCCLLIPIPSLMASIIHWGAGRANRHYSGTPTLYISRETVITSNLLGT
jgi:hypothetical protein